MPRPLAATGVSLLFSLPAGTDVSRFPAFAPANWWPVSLLMGCPIRTPADQRLPASPRRFAACCVLPRLLEPRYPPSALAFFFRQALLTGGVLVSLSLLSSECQWSLSPLAEDSPRTPPRRITELFPLSVRGLRLEGFSTSLVENKGSRTLDPLLARQVL